MQTKGDFKIMKHLLLLGTGGTIACKRGENGLTPLLTGDELLSYVPDAKKFCEVETSAGLKHRQHKYAPEALAEACSGSGREL